MFNHYTSFKRLWRPPLIGGIAPVAPINHLAMLHDYIGSKQRYITCPSQDLVYGFGIFGPIGRSMPSMRGAGPRRRWSPVSFLSETLPKIAPNAATRA